VRFYPPGWRARYEEELRVLLTERPATLATLLDLLRGALDARLNNHVTAQKEQVMKANSTLASLTSSPAFRQGVIFGVVLGLFWIAYNLINSTMNLEGAGASWLNNGQTVSLLVLFGLAGLRTARATGQISNGTLAGFWTWLISSGIAIITLWIFTFVFMESIRHNTYMIEDFRSSGAQSMDIFILEDAVGASTFGIALALVIGVVAATLGGLIGKGLSRPEAAQ
jgi:hypothetical protein